MKKILIIEDDGMFAQILMDQLTKAGFNVLRAADAYQGQQAVNSLKPDLIILDLMLPAGHGLDVLRNLRASFLTQSIPIIILTALKDEGIRQEVEAVGVQAYLTKPYQSEELIQKIKTILG